MPRNDAKALDRFFRQILIPESLAYTLVGVKPLSFACYREEGGSFRSLLPPNQRLIQGWKVWCKYRHLFENPNLLFWCEKSPWVDGINCIILADLDNCHRVIEENRGDFAEIIGAPIIDPFKDVGVVPFFKNTLKMHEALIGLLLGFGRENSWLYWKQRLELSSLRELSRVRDPTIQQDSFGYSWKYCTFQSVDMFHLKLPQFVGQVDSRETKQLMDKYIAAREAIRGFYQNRDFLSATLSLYKNGPLLMTKPFH